MIELCAVKKVSKNVRPNVGQTQKAFPFCFAYFFIQHKGP